MKDVVVLMGAGLIGVAIARRVSYGKHLVVADINLEHAEQIAKDLNNAGFETSAIKADLSSRKSIFALIKHSLSFGNITNLINAAGVSPSQAPIEAVLKVDLYGTAVLMEELGKSYPKAAVQL